jgi:hypothetical protein
MERVKEREEKRDRQKLRLDRKARERGRRWKE